MAKKLYDYWFVQFDFPDENGKPYKSSGGKMVYNEVLKREIPEGWEVKSIKDIANTYSGGTPKSTEPLYYENGTIPWINSGELNNTIIVETSNYITDLGLENSSAKYYTQNTILVALYGATAGKVSLLTFEATSNQAICGVMPYKHNHNLYLYQVLSSLCSYYMLISSGSARDNISQETIKNTFVCIPTDETLNKFNDLTLNLFKKIIVNYQQNVKLTTLRNRLLPLLMNGQVTVKQ